MFNDYMDDTEVAIFYALALRASAIPTDKSYSKQRAAGEILKDLFEEEPNHPVIAHYIIHSYDYPELAELGLSNARRYEDIAPNSAHAQHMPSHIYIRTVYYHKGTLLNISAISADSSYVSACNAQGAYPLSYFPHNYHFMTANATLEGNSKWVIEAANNVAEHSNALLMK